MRKFTVVTSCEEPEVYTSIQELAELIAENGVTEDVYDEMLDECYEEVKICGYGYSPSVALYRTDKIAYDCGLSDYRDSQMQDIKYSLDNMCDGDEESFYDYDVTCTEDEE